MGDHPQRTRTKAGAGGRPVQVPGIRAQKRQRGRWRWRRQTEVGQDAEDESHPGGVEHEEGHPAQEAEGEVQPGPQEGARAEVLAQVGHGDAVVQGEGIDVGEGGWEGAIYDEKSHNHFL